VKAWDGNFVDITEGGRGQGHPQAYVVTDEGSSSLGGLSSRVLEPCEWKGREGEEGLAASIVSFIIVSAGMVPPTSSKRSLSVERSLEPPISGDRRKNKVYL